MLQRFQRRPHGKRLITFQKALLKVFEKYNLGDKPITGYKDVSYDRKLAI
jgi:hypothetical protein